MTPTSPPSPSAAGSPSALCLLCGASNSPSASTCNTCGSPLSPAAPLGSDAGELSGDFSGFARALPSHTSLRNGDYRILGVLGQGGFGITYRASNQRLEREVAIKEFFPATCERVGRSVSASGGLTPSDFDSLRAAFMEEARILARFELPAVVRVMGAWEENASAYMEMEILHGPTLAQVLEEREKLPVEATLRLFEPVIDALEAVHNAGWLHRDIKPHNIIFEPHLATPTSIDPKRMDLASCRAVLLDFGAAKKVAANVSQSFSVIVTPGYAPLEQYATRARRGAFTDVYALCATLYHALSGQAPPAASDRALHDDLIPLRELRPEVPPVVARAIEEGLQTSIARRPQTMGELRELLRGRGALQMAVQAAATEARDPKAGHLKARQQSILSNIQSINDPKSEQAQQKLISSLPVSNEALQMLHNAAQGAAQNAAQAAAQAPQQPAIPASAIGKPLPTARPTYGGAGGSGGHRLENRNVPGTWSNGVYITAIGIGLLMLATAGPILSHFFAPAPPPPPIEEPYVIEPLVAEPPVASHTQPQRSLGALDDWERVSAVSSAQLSPDGRYFFSYPGLGRAGIWDTASTQLVLDAKEVAEPLAPAARSSAPTASSWRTSWSPGSKYLLVLRIPMSLDKASGQFLSNPLNQAQASLFNMETQQSVWQKSLRNVENTLLSWDLSRQSVWLCLNNEMRCFSLITGEDSTPAGPLAINSILRLKRSSSVAPSLRLFEDSPTWLRTEGGWASKGRVQPSKFAAGALETGDLGDTEATRSRVGSDVGFPGDTSLLASRRGRWLLQYGPAKVGENVVRIVSFDGTLKNEWRGKRSDDVSASFDPIASPDGRIIAHRRFSNLLRLWDVESGEDKAVRFALPRHKRLEDNPGYMLSNGSSLSSNNSGSRWLIVDDQEELCFFDTGTKKMLAAPGVVATSARFSFDGRRVAWLSARTGRSGVLPISAFTKRVRCEMVDAPTSRPEVLAP